MRIVVNIDAAQIGDIDRLARQRKRSRASLIREAVAGYLDKRRQTDVDDAFGLWGHRKVDGSGYQDSIRSEW